VFIAANRIRIAPGRKEICEALWRKRGSHLGEVPAPKKTRLGHSRFEAFEVVP
jgi:hypothetical protein